MKARHIILTILAAVLITAPTAVLAQTGPGPGQGGGPGGGWGGGYGPHGGAPGWHGGGMGGDHLGFFEHALPRMAELLELSDEQLERIQAIADAARPEIEGYIEQLREAREGYRAANDDPTVFNEGTFRTHAATQHEIQTDLMVTVGQAKAKVFQILTPEQREQLEEMRSNFGKRSTRRGGGRRSTN